MTAAANGRFVAIFRREPSVRADAPGRVNLMGEHTDYNGGYVLPMPIPQRTEWELAARDDGLVRVVSSELGASLVSYELGVESHTGSWIDYVQGVTRELRRRGHSLRGFDAYVSSSVPVGAGLSSSAALTVSLLRGLRTLCSLALDDVELARVAQSAETDFVGAPVGIMDQMAASLGRAGSALLIDTESLVTRDVLIPSEFVVGVIASGITHAHGTGEYKLRRAECERAAVLLGVRNLRALSRADLGRVEMLDAPLDRRVRHVIEENERVLATVRALEHSDRNALRTLFADSHASLRDDFEVSLPSIDRLVAIASAEPGVIGARLTGGGFGGSVVLLAERERGLLATGSIAQAYARETGLHPSVLLPVEESDGS